MLRVLTFGLLLINALFVGSVDVVKEKNVDPAVIDYKNARVVVLKNVKINEIPENYFRDLKLDLSLLRITNSQLRTIDERAFDGLDHLNRLELTDDQITHIEPKTFARLNGLEQLQLESNKIRHVSLALNHVQEIVLAHNRIENLGEDFITGDSVNFVDLSSNRLKRLKHSMKSLVKLSSISVANNQITEIAPEVFRDNENLVSIYASGNQLTSTQGLRLKQLKILDISSNNLTILNRDSFPENSFLDELRLNSNKITKLDSPFLNTKNLRFLDLSDNLLTDLDPSLFIYNTNLSKLRLSKNRIRSLKPFRNDLIHLTVLDLSRNGLETIDPNFFRPIEKLEILDLSFNKLSKIGDLLTPLAGLTKLDLSSNALVMSRNTLRSNVKLTNLNLSSNGLELSLSDLSKNNQLRFVDLSRNNIENFCDVELSMDSLASIDLSNNRIRELSCFKNNDILPFAMIDIRQNPLTCDDGLNDVIAHFVLMQSSPFRIQTFDIKDVNSPSHSRRTMLDLWNKVKRELCPKGLDIHIKAIDALGEERKNDEDVEVEDHDPDYLYIVSEEVMLPDESEVTETPESGVRIRVGFEEQEIGQSERESWDTISKVENVAAEYEDGNSNIFHITKSQLNVFTITLIFVGVALILILANAIIFMYIRMRGWKSEFRGEQRYTHLENKVYKDTTVPNDFSTSDGQKFENNYRINCARMFSNFGFRASEDESELAKKMIADHGLKAEV